MGVRQGKWQYLRVHLQDTYVRLERDYARLTGWLLPSRVLLTERS